MHMKGIVLAGGAGTRLHPLTRVITKQLLPVYDKPMIYYPLSVLMLAGLQEILLISTPEDQPSFRRLLGDGSQWGIKLHYAIQATPGGIAEALLIAKDFLNGDSCALILGDNILYMDGLQTMLKRARIQIETKGGAVVFAYQVADPERYGVVEFSETNQDETPKVMSIEEKPKIPRSNFAVIGLYFYDGQAPQYVQNQQASARGELEITDLNRQYLEQNSLHCIKIGRGAAWLDAGTHDSLLESSQFVATLEKRQGLKIADLNEIGHSLGWVGRDL